MRFAVSSFTQVARRIAAPSAPIAFQVLIGASIFWAQASLAPLCAAQETPATYPVDGVVENSLTREPIARALVQSNQDAVLTDSNGHFVLQLPAGAARITVRRPGYEGGTYGVRETMHIVKVGPGISPLTFFLTPSAGITAHVTLSSGDAADGLQFMLYRKRIVDGRSRWMQEGNWATGSDGVLRLPSLEAPASYVLCSSPSPDHLSTTGARAQVSGYPAACYPGGADLASATASPLRLAPGQQAQMEISLTRQPFYPITISVAGSTIHPGVPQVFDRSGRPMTFAMNTNQNGSFQVSLPNGSYYAEVRSWGPSEFYAGRDFTVSGAPVGLTLVPTPTHQITVEVHTEFTANPDRSPSPVIHMGIVGAGNRAVEPPINLSLIPADKPLAGPFGVNFRHPEGSSDSNLYEMDAPTQGTYWIEASRFDSYVSSMTSGATDLLREPLVISAGSSVQPIEITLRNDVGWLQLSARAPSVEASTDSSGAGDLSPVSFYCIPLSPNQRRIYQAAVQAPFQETASLPLPPGSYSVVAFENEHEIDLDDQDEMSRLATHAQTITIQPGATAEIQMDPISGGEQEASQ
jgi:hypothetical protein